MLSRFRTLAHRPRWASLVMTLFLLLAVLLLGAAAPGAAGTAAQESGSPLFLDLPAALGAPPAPPAPPAATARERLARIDVDALADPARNRALRLNLFDDVTFVAERDQAGPAYGDGYAWVGRVAGAPTSLVILVRVNEAVAGLVMDGAGRAFEVRYAGAGRHALRELDGRRFPDEAPPLRVPPELLGEAPPAPSGEGPVAALADDTSRIDFMAIYTDDARAAAGGEDAMKAEVYLAVEVTNQAYVNSNIVQRLNLVHTREMAYSETANSATDLARVQNTGDGFLDQIHTLRDRYGADVVTLLVETMEGTACGRGYVMETVGASFAPWAFNVVDRECASSNLSMPHELGHNMGAKHDWYVDVSTSPYSYAHGYVDVANRWRTVMAYNNECNAQTPSVYCARVPYFSNPSVNYGGSPTGTAAGTNTSCTAGNLSNPNCDADVRTTLNNTRATVSAFRNTSPGRDDAWMKDTWDDTGGQPDANTAGQAMWQSPYLWVRNAQDNNRVFQHEHQNPINAAANYVYAKLQSGRESSMSGTMRLYWAEAAAGLSWPADWTNFANVPVTIPANSTQVIEGSWTPTGLGHYCLLARWDASADPMGAEGASVDANVRANNNIIWKNVEVVPFTGPDCEKERSVSLIARNVGNLRGEPVETFDLVLRPARGAPADWLRAMDYVDLELRGLAEHVQGLEGFEKVGETRLRLIDPQGGVLRGINLKFREQEQIRVILKASCQVMPDSPRTFGLDVVEIAAGDKDPVGGVTYIVSRQPAESGLTTVSGAKFLDRDKDGYWDEDGSEPPLPGWEIRADNLQGNLRFSAITDATGRYRLELPRDIYRVYEVQREGWVQTAPAAREYRLDLWQFELGEELYDIDFGNYQDRPAGDLGDAPDSTNHTPSTMLAYTGVFARFPTVYGDAPAETRPGPMHRDPRGQAWLGRGVSLEWDADLIPDEDLYTNLAPAAGRANRDRYDDGVSVAEMALPNCAPATFKYNVHVEAAGIEGWYANVWIDFNRDGDWEDKFECRAGDQILSVSEWAVQDQRISLAAGDHTVEAPEFVSGRAPAADGALWMRITLAEQAAPRPQDGSGPEGGYAYGETEDYLLNASTARPNLEIVKTAEGLFMPGRAATYRLQVTNKGADAAPGPVTVVDELPVGITYVSVKAQGWNCSLTFQTVTCEMNGGLAAGVAATPIELAVSVTPPQEGEPPAEARNCATVYGAGDIDEADNMSCVTTAIRIQSFKLYLPLMLKNSTGR